MKPLDIFRGWDRYDYLMLSLSILFILLKLPVLGLPLYWDEPAYMDARLWDWRSFELFLPWNTQSLGLNNHPPGQQFALYLFALFLPESMVTIHFTALVFSLNLMIFGYLWLKMMFGGRLALTSILLFFSTPIAFSLSTQWLPDLPNLSLAMSSLYFYQKRRWPLFLLFGFWLGLISESSLGYLAGILLYALWEFRAGKVSLKGPVTAVLAHAGIVFFFVKKKFLLGAFTNHPAILLREQRSGFHWLQIKAENLNALRHINEFIQHNNGLLITALFLALAIYLIVKKRSLFTGLAPLGLFALFFYGFFFVYGDYHPRNTMPVYFFLSFLAAFGLDGLLRKKSWFMFGAALLLARNVAANFTPYGTGDANIVSYVRETKLCQETVDWLVDNKIPGPLYASFPIAFFLEDARSGYLERPYEVVSYYNDGQWRSEERVKTKTAIVTNIEGNDNIAQINAYLEKRFRLIKSIEHKGVRAWIFTRESEDDISDIEDSGI